MYNITSSEVYYFAEGFFTASEATNLKRHWSFLHKILFMQFAVKLN